jgi:hypothetical protein
MKTKQVAKLLGVTYSRLYELLRTERLRPPGRDGSGDYWWFAKDIKAARAALNAIDAWRAARKKEMVPA